MRKPFDCPRCGKVFSGAKGAQQHIDAVHRDGSKPRRRPTPQRDETEMSLADISVEAHLKQAMGEALDDLEQSLIFE